MSRATDNHLHPVLALKYWDKNLRRSVIFKAWINKADLLSIKEIFHIYYTRVSQLWVQDSSWRYLICSMSHSDSHENVTTGLPENCFRPKIKARERQRRFVSHCDLRLPINANPEEPKHLQSGMSLWWTASFFSRGRHLVACL